MKAPDCAQLARWYATQVDDAEVRRLAFEMTKGAFAADKANRWLGYLQGWMVAKGYYTVSDVRRHVREIYGSTEERGAEIS